MGNVTYLWKSLYSNKAILEGRKKPWYFTLLFFILGIFLPWIPVLSSGYTSNAASFITQTQNYEIDKGLTMLSQQEILKSLTIQTDGETYSLSIPMDDAFIESNVNTAQGAYRAEYDGTNEKTLARGYYCDSVSVDLALGGDVYEACPYVAQTNSSWLTNRTQTFYFDALFVNTIENPTMDSAPSSSTSSDSSSSSSSIQYEDNGKTYYLLAYYLPDLDTSTQEGAQLLVNFVYSVVLNVSADGSTIGEYPHSYIVFTKNSFSLVTYPLRSAKTNGYGASYMNGSFSDGVSFASPSSGTSLYDFFHRDATEDAQVLSNIEAFFNGGYRNNTIRSTWINCGILSAVFAGLVLLSSGIVIFLVKRKTSAYRDTNYWEAIKISVTLAFTPSLLAMAIGFMSFEYGLGILVLGVLFRVIFMNGKINPPRVEDSKPLYQARQ